MKTSMVGLIYTGEQYERLECLTRVRSVAALPILGRYRMIDFMLSGMVNSGIRNVGVILQKNYQSLLDQLGSGKEWDLHGKRAGMTLLPPFAGNRNSSNYEGLLDALKSNYSFLRRSRERYIAVTDSNVLYAIDFEDVLKQHLDCNADITLVYTKEREARRNGVGRYLGVREDHVVTHLEIDPSIPRYENTYLGVFMIRRELLMDLVDRATSQSFHHFTRELLAKVLADAEYRVCGYEYTQRSWLIDSVAAYYQANMDALDPNVRKLLFSPERPIWTKLRDEMPTRYAEGAKVSNSLVADGCIIEGTVEDSVLFRGVTVAPGAIVRGCIIMQDAVISRNALLENCILDKLTTVREDKRLVAPSTFPIVVGKNLTI